MGFKPTINQQRVLDAKDKNILVSASAGTGKTTVMIQKISDIVESRQASLKELLVITFTNLAAFEMKKRLVAKLSQSGDKDILAQIEQIDLCNISTIDSFCGDVVRKYFVEAEIDPAYKILSDVEHKIAFDKTMDDLFNGLYEQYDKDFLFLVEVFGSGRKDDKLRDLVKKLYDFKRTKFMFEDWLKNSKAKYDVVDGETYFTKKLNEQMASEFECIKQMAEQVLFEANALGLDDDFVIYEDNRGRKTKFAKLKDYFCKMRDGIYISKNKTLEQNLAELNQLSGFGNFVSIDPSLCCQDGFVMPLGKFFDFAKQSKDKANEILKGFKVLVAGQDKLQLVQHMTNSCQICQKAFDLVQKFEDAFAQYKKQNGYLDFMDLEHSALKVLAIDRVRDEVKKQFKFVFVDEYQDVNEIQEAIISLVKRDDNLFLVGDVKQSIYAFRQCEPNIFIEKMQAYGKDAQQNHLEFLNENYRSDFVVLDFVNHIFKNLMTKDFGAIDYEATSMFDCPQEKKELNAAKPSVTVDVVKKNKSQEDGCKQADIEVYSVDRPQKTVLSLKKAEAKQIAKFIREVVALDGGTKFKYSDVAILTRGRSQGLKQIVDELSALGVAVSYSAKQKLFDSQEMSTLINLFKVVDNVYDDIPFYGCLTSCFCGLTYDQITNVFLNTDAKMPDEKTSKYLVTRVREYCQAHDNIVSHQLQGFLAYLDKLKFLAQHTTVSNLISKIFTDTEFCFYVLGLPDGDVRLQKLNEFSNSLQGKTYNKNIGEFLKFVSATQDSDVEVENATEPDAVRVMTIHGSKGLEFPIVFLVDCDKGFNVRLPDIVCDKQEGFACKSFDIVSRKQFDTVSCQIIKEKRKNAIREEEMRLLYVAMTRAKHHLYITGCAGSNENKKTGCYLDWILSVLSKQPYENNAFSYKTTEVDVTTALAQQNVRQDVSFMAFDQKQIEEAKQQLQKQYAHQFATTMELKAVSSKLHSYQKPTDDEYDLLPKIVAKEVEESDVEQNQIGTGYHLVFEHLDFAKKTMQHIEQTIDGLVQQGKLEQKVADLIDKNIVLNALNASVFDGIQNKKVYRELPFLLKTNYQNLFDGPYDETMFLQGVLDMLIIDGSKAIVVDYKYTRHPKYIKQNYQKQLDSYAQAVKQVLGFDEVKKYVLSLYDGKLVEL